MGKAVDPSPMCSHRVQDFAPRQVCDLDCAVQGACHQAQLMYVGHLLQHSCTLHWLTQHRDYTHLDFRCSQPVAVFEKGIAHGKEAMKRQKEGGGGKRLAAAALISRG